MNNCPSSVERAQELPTSATPARSNPAAAISEAEKAKSSQCGSSSLGAQVEGLQKQIALSIKEPGLFAAPPPSDSMELSSSAPSFDAQVPELEQALAAAQKQHVITVETANSLSLQLVKLHAVNSNLLGRLHTQDQNIASLLAGQADSTLLAEINRNLQESLKEISQCEELKDLAFAPKTDHPLVIQTESLLQVDRDPQSFGPFSAAAPTLSSPLSKQASRPRNLSLTYVPTSWERNLRAGMICFQRRDYSSAISCFDACCDIVEKAWNNTCGVSPRSLHALSASASKSVDLKSTGAAAASSASQTAIADNHEDVSATEAQLMYCLLGKTYQILGRFRQAKDCMLL